MHRTALSMMAVLAIAGTYDLAAVLFGGAATVRLGSRAELASAR